VKHFYLALSFLLIGFISTHAQIKAISINEEPGLLNDEAEAGSIQGKITTTDNQPAAYVTVGLKR
jgi:hypothetical protein